MQYTCRDCSYNGNRRSDNGGCPACGSFNIQGYQQDGGAATQERPHGKLRLFILIALWSWLIFEIYRKLYL